MSFDKMLDEYSVRAYHWAQADFKNQIAEGFPILRPIRSRTIWRFVAWMDSLPHSQKDKAAHALVKRSFPRALVVLQDGISTEDKSWEKKYQAAMSEPFPGEFALNDAEIAGRIGPLINRRRLTARIRKDLRDIIGQPLLNLGGGSQVYGREIQGFRVETWVDVGGAFSMRCRHAIPIGEQVWLAESIDILSYWGMGGGPEWQYLTEDDMELAISSLRAVCSHILNALPAFLEGLVPSLSNEELESFWRDLGFAAPSPAYMALWKLGAFPRETLPFVTAQLLGQVPARPADPGPSVLIVADLEAGGKSNDRSLGKVKDREFFDIRTRMDPLFQRLHSSGVEADKIRKVLGIIVLELIANPEAYRVLRLLVESDLDPLLREKAKISLGNLT